jgi:hypothetical protein
VLRLKCQLWTVITRLLNSHSLIHPVAQFHLLDLGNHGTCELVINPFTAQDEGFGKSVFVSRYTRSIPTVHRSSVHKRRSDHRHGTLKRSLRQLQP